VALCTRLCNTRCRYWCLRLFVCMWVCLALTMIPLLKLLNFDTTDNSNECTKPGNRCHPMDLPKQVHQMWKTDIVPKKWKRHNNHCKKINPTYKFILWSDGDIEQLFKDYYPWFLPMYYSYPYNISRTDAARYFIIYHYGGVYLDLDIECKVPFGDILTTSTNKNIVLGSTAPFGITNSVFATQQKSELLNRTIQGLVEDKGWYGTPYMTVMMSTGCLFFYKRYIEFPLKDSVYMMTVEQQKHFFIHRHASTWHSWDGLLVRWMDRHYYIIIVGVTIALIVAVFLILRRICRKAHITLSHKSI